jgi:shikimate dehydrogenase
MSELKIYAVVGRPVLHSHSPRIFNLWFRASGMNAVYTRLVARSAEDAVRTARAMKLAGINVTSPYKEEIMDLLDGADAHAAKIGAVNCVVPRKTRLWGYNTDFLGAVRALTRSGVDPRGKNIAILGAGGAARSAAYGLMRRRAARVTILNRTEERARNAARAFGCDSAPLERADDVIRKSDILISCISSRAASHETYLRNKKLVVLRADYRDSPPLTGRSRRKYPLIGGQEWLIGQAVPAFRHFTGRNLPARLEGMARAMDLSTRPAEKPNIALVGFMGSGKTATGRVLARKMGWDLVDTDTEIEKRSGMSVPKMFKTRGETFFREMEKSLIAGLVPSAKGKIFSLGGGAVLDEDTRSLLTRHCQVIWLWTTLETALARIDLPSRPVLHAAGGERAIERAYKARFRACARAADLVLATDDPTPEETGERIRYEMAQTFED